MPENLLPFVVALVILTTISFSKQIALIVAKKLKSVELKVDFADKKRKKRD